MVVTLGGSEVKLWSVESGREQMTLSPHGTVVSADFSPDDQRIVTASWDDSAKIWDANSGQAIMKLAGEHKGNVNGATFSPSGQHVLTCSDDQTARLWNADTGKPLDVVLRGHLAAVLHAEFSSDGTRIVTASRDRTARVWDASTGSELVALHDPSLRKLSSFPTQNSESAEPSATSPCKVKGPGNRTGEQR